jgi:hypothetical protein
MRDIGIDYGSKGAMTHRVSTNEGGQAQEERTRGESLIRAVAGRGKYLGPDRVDMQLAATDISRFIMPKPEEQNCKSAKRLARYMKDIKRVVIEYKFKKLQEKVVVWSDTDFAGCKLCKRTRRSTSRDVVMFGSHCVKTYSQTQDTIALSSGESEFYGIVKAAMMGLGMKGLLEDLGVSVEVQVNTDSSAAKSIGSRGAGGVRHIEVREFWIQDRVAKGELTVVKVE